MILVLQNGNSSPKQILSFSFKLIKDLIDVSDPKIYKRQARWPLLELCLDLTILDVQWPQFFFQLIIFSTDFLCLGKK